MPPLRSYDGRAIANFILDLADVDGTTLSQMQLLKIIYFAHGWFLVAFRFPLVEQSFEAWDYGPVVRVVREAFKAFGKQPITSRAERFDMFTGEVEIVSSYLDPVHAKFVEDVYRAYRSYDAWQLSDMTHEVGSPWDKIWNAEKPIGRLALRISNDEIFSHFSSVSAAVGVSH